MEDWFYPISDHQVQRQQWVRQTFPSLIYVADCCYELTIDGYDNQTKQARYYSRRYDVYTYFTLEKANRYKLK